MNAIVDFTGDPVRRSVTSALMGVSLMSLRMRSRISSLVSRWRALPYRPYLSTMSSSVARVITCWLMTWMRSSAKLVTVERTSSCGISCSLIRMVAVDR